METPYAALVAPERLAEFAPGISWSVLPGDGMTLVYWVFEPPHCGDVPLHQHAVAQGGVVLEGSVTMRYADGSERTLRAGDVYTVGSNVPHGATFPERCVVVDVFTPNRVEYEERFAAGTRADSFVVVAERGA
ncbi:MAG: cupin domain-containing protein [Candidatus Eremiobacteraeota bacterium]|nr:cupin domain-containing protein [Candidatus Eremiobacteraeota bacterium]